MLLISSYRLLYYKKPRFIDGVQYFNLEFRIRYRQDELDVLLVLVEGYENKHHQMPQSDPVDAILFLMDQLNLTRKDLEVFLGPKSRVSDVLNRKRNLTLPQIVKLHKELHIPYESLIEERHYL